MKINVPEMELFFNFQLLKQVVALKHGHKCLCNHLHRGMSIAVFWDPAHTDQEINEKLSGGIQRSNCVVITFRKTYNVSV